MENRRRRKESGKRRLDEVVDVLQSLVSNVVAAVDGRKGMDALVRFTTFFSPIV